jgi:hypothetical protein
VVNGPLKQNGQYNSSVCFQVAKAATNFTAYIKKFKELL